MEWLDGDICYRAMEARDPRFERAVVHGSDFDGNLLPANLSSAHAEARELSIFSKRRRRRRRLVFGLVCAAGRSFLRKWRAGAARRTRYRARWR